MAEHIDWYERRDELEPGQVFRTMFDSVVRLDRRVPGDGTDWYADDWYPGLPGIKGYEKGHWSAEDGRIHPGDLTERLPDNYAGED
jgi:hypothetical protein